MKITLEKAPLVELVAELFWSPALMNAQDESGKTVTIPASLLDPSGSEPFFMRFNGEIYRHGFRSVERLVPQGMILPGQMVYRYRQADTNPPPILVQIGTTQFSVNALPPYKNWADFRPWIEKSVSALLAAHEEPVTFRAGVRYIDAFRKDIMAGASPSEFLSSVLKFEINPPNALKTRAKGPIKASVDLVVPLDGMRMKVIAKEANIQGDRVALMDMHVAILKPVPSDLDAIMQAFDAARNVIHDSFFEIADPVMDQLQPKREG